MHLMQVAFIAGSQAHSWSTNELDIVWQATALYSLYFAQRLARQPQLCERRCVGAQASTRIAFPKIPSRHLLALMLNRNASGGGGGYSCEQGRHCSFIRSVQTRAFAKKDKNNKEWSCTG